MDFELDEAQREIVGLTREVLEKELDPDAAWTALGRAGLLTLAVPEECGGAGLGLLETALVLTEVGRSTAAIPALETLALGVLPVATLGTPDQRAELLGALAEGTVLTAALHEPSAPLPTAPRTEARPDADGWLVSGTLLGVRFADRAHRILVPATLPDGRTGVLLVDPSAPGCTRTRTHTSSGLPEFRVHLDQARVGPAGLLGGTDADRSGRAVAALHQAAVLGACALADGVLAGALRLTATHLRTREQFGRPLATFQAAAAQVADVYLASRTLHLATTAACRLPNPGDTAVAGYWLTERLTPALHTCQHLHGGIGVDSGYPLHRHYAWGKDLARFVGGVEHRLAAVADTRVVGGERDAAPELTEAQHALREELREYFAGLLTPEQRETMLIERHGPVFREMVRRMGRDGWLGVGWPVEYGGRGFGQLEQQIFVNEAARADIQLPSVTLQTVGPTLQHYGTHAQRERFLPAILAGEVHFAIGYTEPGAGTDLAALRTTAVRRETGDSTGDSAEYLVNGQKVFTTGAHDADYIWLAVRTDPDAPAHRGISIVIVDTRDPGYSWTPIITCDGAHHTNSTYFTDMRVPASMLVGEENRGWRLITTQLNHERVMLGPAGWLAALRDRVADWVADRAAPDGRPLAELPDVRRALARATAAYRVNELLNWQVAASSEGGAQVNVADASATKVFGTEAVQWIGREMEEVVARHGDPGDPATQRLARWLDLRAKRNLVLTFGGGVNEIQREFIASFGLDLPRVPR